MSEIKIPRQPPPYPFESYSYLVESLPEDEGGGYQIGFPDLPGCMSDGLTEAEALENARDAFASWISARLNLGKPIPAPTHHAHLFQTQTLKQHLPHHLQSDLINRAQAEGTSLEALIVKYLADGLNRREARG
jgi:antitoxin HicB